MKINCLLLVLVAAALLSCTSIAASQPRAFMVNGRSYAITACASTPAQREAGLMNATVTNSTFMLFTFDKPGIYRFWMKDTYAPLDIIWLNGTAAAATVVSIVSAVPCVSYSANQSNCIVYTPSAPANYVIETRAGFVEQNKIAVGSRIAFLH